MARKTKQRLVEQIIAWAKGQKEIVAVYLFGSQVAGDTLPDSDLDVGVLARYDLLKERLWRLEDRWIADWARPTTPRVDLVLLNLAPIPLRFEVVNRGRMIWTADTVAAIEFESITRRRYWDLEPMLQWDWAGFVRQLEEERSEAERREYQAALEKVRAVHRRVREAADHYPGSAES